MIKYICSGVVPRSRIMKRLCYPNIDRLLQLSAMKWSEKDRAVEKMSGEFSAILSDICINGVWKRTLPGRLKETEHLLCTCLKDRNDREIRFLDLGGADGVTTLDALNALRRNHITNIRVCLADLYFWLLRYQKGPVAEYRSTDGKPVMLRMGRFGLRLWNPHSSRLARYYLSLSKFRERMEVNAEIPLVNPLVLAEPALTILEMDCLHRNVNLTGTMDAIRASNILSPVYFTHEQILDIVSHLHAYLRKHGYLIVSRNFDSADGEETAHGSLWRKEDNTFIHIEDFGKGSEIKTLIAAKYNS